MGKPMLIKKSKKDLALEKSFKEKKRQKKEAVIAHKITMGNMSRPPSKSLEGIPTIFHSGPPTALMQVAASLSTMKFLTPPSSSFYGPGISDPNLKIRPDNALSFITAESALQCGQKVRVYTHDMPNHGLAYLDGFVSSIHHTDESRKFYIADPENVDKKWLCSFDDEEGWIILNTNLSIRESPKTLYKPGQNLNDYVTLQIREESDKERIKWLETFQRCVLSEIVRETIEEALTVVLCKDKFDAWGINSHFEKGITNAVLLYGPPGTGKTMIAESMAAVLNKPLLTIGTAELQSQIPGQMERNIKKSFDKAKTNEAVILLDECDSLLYNREAVGAIMSSEINCLLQEIERFDGVIILTTNRLGKLDPALQRRIIAKIKLPVPQKEQRKQIWKNLLPPLMPIANDIDFEWLAEQKIAGGDIKNAILLAARKAIAKNTEAVTMKHFIDAVSLVLQGKADYKKQRPTSFVNGMQIDNNKELSTQEIQ